MNKIKISQKLSLIGKTKKQISCVKGLGLRRIRDSKIIEATPENLGMIIPDNQQRVYVSRRID